VRQKLTKTLIESALATGTGGKAAVHLWDDVAGLGLRIRANGKASWIYFYRPRGSVAGDPARTLTIGAWPGVSIADARHAAAQYAGERAAGGDPAEDLKKERARDRQRLDLALRRFELELDKRSYVKKQTAMSSLRRNLSHLLKKEVSDIMRADIVDVIEQLEAAGKPGAAGDLRKYAKVLFNSCVNWGWINANPLGGLIRPRKTRVQIISEDEKGRALTDEEMVKVWRACGDMGNFGSLVRMAFLTGARKGELASLRWSDIKDDRIVIRAVVAKTARQHDIPLTLPMKAVLSAIPRTSGALVFPSNRRNEPTQISGWSKLMNGLRAASGVGVDQEAEDHWSLHDCRRTCRTIMSKTGVPEDFAELAIGHVTAALIAKYNKDARWGDRVEAFEKVSAHITNLVGLDIEAGKVTALKARKRA
jgi:integrase